jgi:hypothetical protein
MLPTQPLNFSQLTSNTLNTNLPTLQTNSPLNLATQVGQSFNGASQSSNDRDDRVNYSFKVANFAGDTFTQLLGINNAGIISGYHGAGTTPQNPNKGFILTLPNSFASENFPGSVQTQVVGINNEKDTAGFWVDGNGATHGFFANDKGVFKVVDAPNTAFNQILGLNDKDILAGYSSTDPTGATKQMAFVEKDGHFTYLQSLFAAGTGNTQATSINNKNEVAGFYVDKNNVTHGFEVGNYDDSYKAKLTTIDFPGATSTQVLGINNYGQLSGVYVDGHNQMHGFVDTNGHFQSIDAPGGIGTTTINGINDKGQVVGFFVDGAGNTEGFEASPISHS